MDTIYELARKPKWIDPYFGSSFAALARPPPVIGTPFLAAFTAYDSRQSCRDLVVHRNYY
jgi:hypothetical protein